MKRFIGEFIPALIMVTAIALWYNYHACKGAPMTTALDHQHSEFVSGAALAGSAANKHMEARADRATSGQLLERGYRRVQFRASTATETVKRLSAPLPKLSRDSISSALAAKDSTAALADSVITRLSLDTADLAAAARGYQEQAQLSISADSVSQVQLKAERHAARSAFWRGAALGGGAALIVAAIVTLIVGAAK